MQFTSPGSMLLAAENSPEDDIDRLFQLLHKLEPPVDILQQILSRIKRLPATQCRTSPSPQSEDDKHTPPENQRGVSDSSS